MDSFFDTAVRRAVERLEKEYDFWEKLGTEEEVERKSSGKKYSSAEGFAEYARGLWMKQIIGLRFSESRDKIAWRYEGEEYAAKANLPKACVPLFHCLIKEGPPLFKEIEFDFTAEGTRFKGRIDDVRKHGEKIIIRDYKSGRPWIGQMKINNDPQLTIYNAGLCSLCLSNDEIATKLGMMEKRREFMRNGSYICPDFSEQFFMIEAPIFNVGKKNPMKTIHETQRKNEHFLEVLNMIRGIEQAVADGEIYPERGRKCDECDLKFACEKRLERVGTGHLEDRTGQELMGFMIPSYARTPQQENEKEKMSGQRKIKFNWK